MAAIGLVQLKYLDEDNARRREIVKMYTEGMKDNPNIKIVSAPYADECSYHLFEIIVPDRDDLMEKLADNDIYCGVHYRDNTEYSMYTYANGSCPNAHNLCQHIITLPLHIWLTDEEVEKVIKSVNEIV